MRATCSGVRVRRFVPSPIRFATSKSPSFIGELRFPTPRDYPVTLPRMARVHALACLDLTWWTPVHVLACFGNAALWLPAPLPIDQPAVEAQVAGDLVGHQARDLVAQALQVDRLGQKPGD